MKEITRIEKVYDFDELSESAKENARRSYCENFRESYMFTEICDFRLSDEFPKSKLEVEYDLCYCQGDGLNIYGVFAISDIVKFIRKYYKDYDIVLNHKQKRFMSYLEKQDIDIKTNSNPYHYSYYTDKADDVRYYIELEMEGNYYRDIPYADIHLLATMFDISFGSFCKQMEEDGYSFFYEVDDEEIKETWEANEYEGWSESGKPVYI